VPISRAVFLGVRAIGVASPGAWLVVACVSPISLENRPCPCAADYVCCDSTRICLRPGQVCPIGGGAGAGGAGAGGAGAGDAGRPGSGAGEGGDAGEGEAGGASTGVAGARSEPAWRAVGADLELPQPTNAPNLALDAEGTPYVAFRACDPCGPPAQATNKPVVARYAGVWETMPSTGLPELIKMSPAIRVDEPGRPVVLTEQGVHAFDGERWLPAPELPSPPSEEARLQRDAEGRLHTTVYDGTLGELQVVRLANSSWQNVGAAIPADAANARLHLAGAFAYLAHSRRSDLSDGSELVVRRFDGVAWELVSTLEGTALELALSSAGTVYVAVKDPLGDSARILRYEADEWTELGVQPVSFSAPRLELAGQGTLYMTHVVGNFVTVLRLDGGRFGDLDSAEIGQAISLPALAIAELEGAEVPYVAFLSGAGVRVRKYE